MSDHLRVTTSDRGFTSLPPILDEYGGTATVYESSAASAPHIWLNVKGSGRLHLTVESAQQLAEQLMYLVQNHYQN
jgi:hypothetical protein